VQLGDGALLARLAGRPVVYDLRAADVAAGGQGAPLAPVYHRALAADIAERPVAVLNLGGVANITWIGRDGTLIAFDTGPASAMIDDWVQTKLGKPFDADGRIAARGAVHESIVADYLRHPHFAELPPKSLDRNAFSLDAVAHLSPEDGAATLAAFTAASIAQSLSHLPEPPQLLVISGGGRRNDTMVAMIAQRTGIDIQHAEDFGIDGDGVEAEAWAFLAVRSALGLPITFPGTTGVSGPLTGGVRADPA
jgi:anhydro-N-acetylmuramic acid kinase